MGRNQHCSQGNFRQNYYCSFILKINLFYYEQGHEPRWTSSNVFIHFDIEMKREIRVIPNIKTSKLSAWWTVS